MFSLKSHHTSPPHHWRSRELYYTLFQEAVNDSVPDGQTEMNTLPEDMRFMFLTIGEAGIIISANLVISNMKGGLK